MGGLTIADRWRMLNADARQQLMHSDPFGLVPDHLITEVERAGLPFALAARWEHETGPERRFLHEDVQNWMMGIANTLGETSARAYFPASLLPALPPRYEWAATLNVDGIDVASFPE